MIKIPDSSSFKPVPGAAEQPPRREVTAFGRIFWQDDLEFSYPTPRGSERAVVCFLAALPNFVFNAAALEGNTFTLLEVRTLLDNVTVAGKRIEEVQQILAIRDAVQLVADRVRAGTFRLDKATSDAIHGTVAQYESIESGAFRGEGSVTGGGHVQLSDGTRVEGIAQADLAGEYANLLTALEGIANPLQRALVYFCVATRTQFYFDGNKRTARLMMAGELLSHGIDAINVPYARRLEFNVGLDELFRTGDATYLMRFLMSC